VPAGEEAAMSTRARHAVMVVETRPGRFGPVADELDAGGFDVRRCDDDMSLIETAASARPRAIVYELHHEMSVDLAVLALVRRVLPRIPLVVVAGAFAEHAARVLRPLRPTVLAREPVDRAELIAAVRTAVRRSRITARRGSAPVTA
jgi:DNA-binding response OmpR family regulator